jgi:ribosomal protein S18 acetylase RimI-like enzyme
MVVRPAQPSDKPHLIEFQQRMALETENLTLDVPTVTRGVEAVFADPHKGRYFVVENEGRVIACLMITYEWSDWRCGQVWWIQSVYVLPAYRGQGVYKFLYLHIKKQVQFDPELRGIRLYVDKTNQAAQGVYSKLGMNGEHYQVFEWTKGG